MPAREQRDEQLFDHILLANDDLGQLALDAGTAGHELFDSLFIGGASSS
jgi:hypothetical protein